MEIHVVMDVVDLSREKHKKLLQAIKKQFSHAIRSVEVIYPRPITREEIDDLWEKSCEEVHPLLPLPENYCGKSAWEWAEKNDRHLLSGWLQNQVVTNVTKWHETGPIFTYEGVLGYVKTYSKMSEYDFLNYLFENYGYKVK